MLIKGTRKVPAFLIRIIVPFHCVSINWKEQIRYFLIYILLIKKIQKYTLTFCNIKMYKIVYIIFAKTGHMNIRLKAVDGHDVSKLD